MCVRRWGQLSWLPEGWMGKRLEGCCGGSTSRRGVNMFSRPWWSYTWVWKVLSGDVSGLLMVDVMGRWQVFDAHSCLVLSFPFCCLQTLVFQDCPTPVPHSEVAAECVVNSSGRSSHVFYLEVLYGVFNWLWNRLSLILMPLYDQQWEDWLFLLVSNSYS